MSDPRSQSIADRAGHYFERLMSAPRGQFIRVTRKNGDKAAQIETVEIIKKMIKLIGLEPAQPISQPFKIAIKE